MKVLSVLAVIATVLCLSRGGDIEFNDEQLRGAFMDALCGEDEVTKTTVLTCMEQIPEEIQSVVIKMTEVETFNDGLLKLCGNDELHTKIEEETEKMEWDEEGKMAIHQCMKPIYEKYGVM